MVGHHGNTRHIPRATRAPRRPYRRLGVLAAIFAISVLICVPVRAQVDTVRSDDDRLLATAVPRGWSQPLLTEIWTFRADGSEARRLKSYLGGPGGLSFLPGVEELLYVQLSLSHGAFGSNIYGGRALPIIRNRVWRLRVDGTQEALWPLPEGLHPLEAAASPGFETIARSGFRGRGPCV